MHCFGDVSGTIQGVLDNRENLFSIAVVCGTPVAATACPNKYLGKWSQVDELKWNSVTSPADRRRVLECITERDPPMEFAYATLTRIDLERLTNGFRLFQGDSLPCRGSVFCKAVSYATLLDELDVRAPESDVSHFYFDRFGGRAHQQALQEQLTEFHPPLDHWSDNSRSRKGLQVADLIAGAARQDELNNTDWLDRLPDSRLVDCSDTCLAKLEAALDSI